MRKYLNVHNVPLSMAVFLATDNYDYEENTISVTKLIKPVRQLVLASRVPESQALEDISGLVKSRMGSAIHDAIERSWVHNKDAAMKALGYPQRLIDKVLINPDPDAVTEDHIPVYLEQRSYREVMGYTVSGKFDFVAEGRVEDFKSTSTMAWNSADKAEDYALQGSMYRWLNPKIVTDDHMAINFLFTDFQPFRAKADPNYPPHATPQKLIPLKSIEETDQFVRNKLTLLERFKDAPEEELPLCTDKELWRKAPEWKYYKNPEKRTRSTKNFKVDEFGSENAARSAAYTRLAKDKNVGVVVEVPGEVVACKYCAAFPICSQKDALIADGSLKL
ncbi:hypothetical protein [uncultured Marinobacter sp.]|mgnify:CR=1 FL=1|uniref:hypothetical protein n=1 Tax=uncultured Marinobacter sp. TaxID=187379 RepID=UPI00259A68FA|nr:hypothetical protein [uncultured Marinobacter sp.]